MISIDELSEYAKSDSSTAIKGIKKEIETTSANLAA